MALMIWKTTEDMVTMVTTMMVTMKIFMKEMEKFIPIAITTELLVDIHTNLKDKDTGMATAIGIHTMVGPMTKITTMVTMTTMDIMVHPTGQRLKD